MERVTRHAFHDVALRLFVGERDGGHHVGAEIDAEDRDGAERQRNVGDDEEKERRDLRDVAGERVGDRLLQVVEDEASWKERAVQRTSITSLVTIVSYRTTV